ncbi:hypothetical protein V8G54_024144 [Vigna mungo]|uniref:TraB domain-containing protein n=1 Tax=Vigna mungo TaxID=3915 RepID=A0AAQ3N535_VIGMU
MFQRLMGHLVTRTRTLNQLARVTPFIHRHKSLLVAPISCSQTLSSLQFSTDTSAFTQHPVRLPEDLSKNLIVLSRESSAEGGVCHVYLVGTCHVSKVLILLVRNQVLGIMQTSSSYSEISETTVINPWSAFVLLQVVFLELCRSRASILTRKNVESGSELGVLPGNEFRVAYEEAIKYGGKVILGDRPQRLREMEDSGMLTLIIQQMNKEFPILMETLVHERDRWMSARLLNVASSNSSVVAVVGKGHLQGIKKYWMQWWVENLIIVSCCCRG